MPKVDVQEIVYCPEHGVVTNQCCGQRSVIGFMEEAKEVTEHVQD